MEAIQSVISAAKCIFFVMQPSTSIWQAYQRPHSQRNLTCFLLAANNYKYLLGYGWCVVSSSPLHAGFCSGLGLLCFSACCHNCYNFTCTAASCAQKRLFHCNLTSSLVTYTLFMSSSAVNRKPWKEWYGTYFSFKVENSAVFYFQNLGQLQISVFVIIYCKYSLSDEG